MLHAKDYRPRFPATSRNKQRATTPTTLLVSSLRVIVALAVYGPDLHAQRPQIRRQLSSMVDRVMKAALQMQDRRPLPDPTEIDDLHELVIRQSFEPFDVCLE